MQETHFSTDILLLDLFCNLSSLKSYYFLLKKKHHDFFYFLILFVYTLIRRYPLSIYFFFGELGAKRYLLFFFILCWIIKELAIKTIEQCILNITFKYTKITSLTLSLSLSLCNQVGTILLGCAFLYDIFWVFVSKWWFHESVMIVVSRP